VGRRDRKRGQRGGPPKGGRRRARSQPHTQTLNPQRVLRLFAGRDRPQLAATTVLRELGLQRDAVHPLRKLLASLEAEGRLERIGRRYRLRRRDGRVEGVFTPGEGSGDGGRVLADDGVAWRVPHSAGAAAGDRVLLQPIGDPGRHRGEILDSLAGRRDHWVGIFQRRGNRGSVTPYRDDADWVIDIARGAVGGARDGDVVVVQPLRRPAGRKRRGSGPRASGGGAPLRFAGEISEVLGSPGTPRADFRAIAWRRKLPLEFPEAVRSAAKALPAEIPADEIERRVDLRDRPFVTIDPASARDHDDALCVEAVADRFRLWVAIADVAAFVPAGSPIDREALRRGNSVYFPDRAIPMLPERLSGDLCSLRPGVDRLVMVVELLVGAGGKVERRQFYAGVIRSRARLVYSEIAPVMAGKGDGGLAPELVAQLRDLARVTGALRRRRLAGGSIELDLPAAEILFGPDGRAEDVVVAQRNVAHRAVEDAMLAANRAVAEALEAAEQPAVHRNHEPPLPQDGAALRELFEVYGLSGAPRGRGSRTASQAPDPEVPSPGWIAAALKRVAGRPEERLIHETVLRSLTQARYGAEARGHFALAFRHYTHFTSPIRRYADLVVHRALSEWIAEAGAASRAAPASREHRLDAMRRIAARVSWRERVAVEAEREALDLQKCAFLQGHVGEEFAATMTGAAPFGLWLTLDDHFVQGLVHLSSLPEFVEYDEQRHTFTARRSGERFELGDRFDVRVEAVDIIRARIDFRILGRRGSEAAASGAVLKN